MDFLDPNKERRTRIALLTGYGLVAIAIAIASLVLLYASYGYTVDKDGDVTQRGLVFVSSTPTGADVALNGTTKAKTNTKLDVNSGSYDLSVSATGYRDWYKKLTVNGGDVQRFDYPFLIPTNLASTQIASYTESPLFVTQSLSKRLILLSEAATPNQFTLLNTRDPKKLETSIITPPASVATVSEGPQRWEPIEWADDNKNVLFLHYYTQAGQEKREYIVLDVNDVQASKNVTRTVAPDMAEELTLFDKQPDAFYGYSPTTKVLRSFTLGSATNRTALRDVVAYKTYADDTVLYATTTPPTGKQTTTQISIVLLQGVRSTVLRKYENIDQKYLLDIAQYDGDWYVIAAATKDKGAYIYKNPQSQVLRAGSLPAAWRFLRVPEPQHVSFSATAQLISAQSAQRIGVYDAEDVVTRLFTLEKPIDAPQPYAEWMDGHHLMYISGGKMIMLDYDNTNLQELVTALPAYKPMFSSDYQVLYTVSTSANVKAFLQSTPLRVTTQ
ncbi:MAG: PEGA domain-containing protein [Candidatus Saccharimonadales bacterium]